MIKSIKISNFCSIGNTQEISFEISKKDVFDDSATEISDTYINLVNCFIGHNASGKTTVLKALSFLFWLMSDSYLSMKSDALIPVEAHKLFETELTKFEIEFFYEEKTFQYIVELDHHHIHREFLGQHIERSYTRIFEYTRSDNDWDFKSSIEINLNDLQRFKEAKNKSVLSSLFETGYLTYLPIIKKFKTNVTSIGHTTFDPVRMFLGVSKLLYENVELQQEALNFIKDADIGISKFGFSEVMINRENKQIDSAEKKYALECFHESEVGNFKLPLIEESHGSRHGLALYVAMINLILKSGGVVILDEFESGLHPYFAKKLIYLFENKETNPHQAQLLFSTHQHLLLNDRTKTQIFIAEKDNKNFETEIFRLDDVEGVRNDDNFFNKYLAGTYGGVPNIKWNT